MLKVAGAWLDAKAAVLLRDRLARVRAFIGIAESMGELGDWKASESWALRAKRLAVVLENEQEVAHADFQLDMRISARVITSEPKPLRRTAWPF